MTTYKCLIIDDDPLITDLVVHYAEKSDKIAYCVACNDAFEGLKLLEHSDFDLLFLDHNMPQLNGKDILDLKRDKSEVIMITANPSFAVDSYRYDAVKDYLLKPLTYEVFEASVNRLHHRNDVQRKEEHPSNILEDTILIKNGNDWTPLSYNDIIFIKSDSNYCIFHTASDKLMTLAKLKSLEVKLPSNFVRCHRSYMINVQHVTKINLEEVHLNGHSIPVSGMYRENIKALIQHYL